MSGVATAIAASAVIGAYASNKASSKQAKGQQKAIDAQNALIGPWSDAGLDALPAVQSFVDQGGDYSQTQAYKDITNSAKASGMSLSGNRLTALTDYYATNFRPQRMNELMAIPTLGQASATNQAANLGNLYSAQGATNAAGVLGMGNAAQSGLNSLAFLNAYKGSGGSYSGPVQPGQHGYGGIG